MKLRDLPPSAIIYVEYERIRCINCFVVWKSSGVIAAFEKKTSKMAESSSLFWKSIGLVAIIIKRLKRLDS